MIGKAGQYLLTINDEEVSSEEFEHLVIEERAGLALPMVKLKFMTQKDELVEKYNTPGYKVTIGYGRDEIVETTDFYVMTRQIANAKGGDNWDITVNGVMGHPEYLTKQRMNHYNSWSDLQRSSEVWSTIMTRADLKPITPKPTDDKMLWLQHNNTDRQFLEEMMWHAWYAEDDPILNGIRRDKEAWYKPLSEIIKKKVGIIGNTDQADIKANNMQGQQNDGFLGSTMGKKRKVPYHSLDDGTDESDEGEVKPHVAPKVGFADKTDRTQEVNFINDNVHKNWWKAFRQARQTKTSLSGTGVYFTCENYNPVKILDYYEVQMQKVDPANVEITMYNGLWIVSKVSTYVVSHGMQQRVGLVREGYI